MGAWAKARLRRQKEEKQYRNRVFVRRQKKRKRQKDKGEKTVGHVANWNARRFVCLRSEMVMKSEEKEEAWGEEEEETRRMNSLRMQEDCFLGRIFKQREKHVQKTKLAVTRQIEKTGKERWRPKAMAVS